MWYNWRAIIGCAGPNFRKVKSFKKKFHDFVQRTQACHFPKSRLSDSGTGNPHMRSHRSQKWHSARERPSLPQGPAHKELFSTKVRHRSGSLFPIMSDLYTPQDRPHETNLSKTIDKNKIL